MKSPGRCWCGSEDLQPFSSSYLSCGACGSLAVAEPPAGDVTRVRDEERDLYGKSYWFEHQRELGLPDLERRSFDEPRERCLHWLDALLRYRLPPGRTLELGCSHGGFVALLDAVGFDAAGLELSPWVAAFARRTFDVAVLEGPLEDQELEPGSFDLIVAMDVLEHLPDPSATMTRAAELLAPDGLLLIQTPCRPADKSHARLIAEKHRFLEMLLPGEHLHLFSERAAGELCRRLGLPHVVFEPAIFGHYDMFLIAGRQPLERRSEEEVRAVLSTTPERRRVLASLELYRDLVERTDALAVADADRRARQSQIDELGGLLAAEREKVETLQRAVEDERASIEILRRERDAERETADTLRRERDAERDAAEALRRERDAEREIVQALRRERDAEREIAAALERDAATLREELARRRRDARQLRAEIRDLDERLGHQRARLEELEREHDQLGALQLRAAGQLRAWLETGAGLVAELAAERERLAVERERLERLEGWYRDLREVVEEHRGSRIYRALVGLGRWRPHDDKVARILDRPAQARGTGSTGDARDGVETTWKLHPPVREQAADERTAIAVDLTALLPGGENGGAKRVAIELARGLTRLEPKRPFVWLTSAACHHELAALAPANARCVSPRPEPGALDELLRRDRVGLLFAPMTAPGAVDPRVPVVSLIHDLQYRTYPEFFGDAERAERERAFRHAVQISERVVTVSEYVRGTVLEHSGLPADRVTAIANGFLGHTPDPSPERVGEMLEAHGLEAGGFLLYPANFWPHKNHRMLLAAFSLFRHRRPGSSLALVLTGAEQPDPEPLCDAARRMGLGDAVRFPGYVSDDQLAALFHGCRALIFPSLYEGFGMPVIEAMARGRPVLCGDRTALPEVAGDAAILFDPRRTESIAGAITRLEDDPELAARLVERGRKRAAEIGDGDTMARAYRRVLRRALAAPRRRRDALVGVHADGWTAPRFTISCAGDEAGRTLDLLFDSPQGSSFEPVALVARSDGDDVRELTVPRCRSLALRCELPPEGGRLEFTVDRPFVPFELGLNHDRRELGLRLLRCRLEPGRPTGDGVDLLAEVRGNG